MAKVARITHLQTGHVATAQAVPHTDDEHAHVYRATGTLIEAQRCAECGALEVHALRTAVAVHAEQIAALQRSLLAIHALTLRDKYHRRLERIRDEASSWFPELCSDGVGVAADDEDERDDEAAPVVRLRRRA